METLASEQNKNLHKNTSPEDLPTPAETPEKNDLDNDSHLAYSRMGEASTTLSATDEEHQQIASQRDEINITADLIRTGELQLSEFETRQLGWRAIELAQSPHTGAADAEIMMTNLAASTKLAEHAIMAHRTINEVFSEAHSSADHRRESHNLASRVIAMTNRDLDSSTVQFSQSEPMFVERFGESSDVRMSDLMQEVKDDIEQEVIDIRHTENQKKILKYYSDAFRTIDKAKDTVTAGNRLINLAWGATEGLPEPIDILLLEGVANRLESISPKFADKISELHAHAEQLVEEADPAEQEAFQFALEMSRDADYVNQLLDKIDAESNESNLVSA